jgi:hypothetical protein
MISEIKNKSKINIFRKIEKTSRAGHVKKSPI